MQRSGSTRFLSSEVRSRHSAAARPSLVARPGANRVPSGGLGFSLPARSCSIVSFDRAPARERLGFEAAAAVGVHDGTGSSQDAALDNRRPRVSCRGCTCVEQSIAGCYAVAIISDLQEETENRTLSTLLPRCLISYLLIAAAVFCVFTLLFRDLAVLRN